MTEASRTDQTQGNFVGFASGRGRALLVERLREHDVAYRWLMRAKHARMEYTARHLAVRARRETAGHLASDKALVVDISGAMGLGSVLSFGGRVLEHAATTGRALSLRFSSPTYLPSWPVEDWLDCYFERSAPVPEDAVVIPVDTMPVRWPRPSVAVGDQLVWDYLSIRPEAVVGAGAIPFQRYASVHYRGTDKLVEAPRQTYDAVLRKVESEMARDGLDKLFVATDETAFVAAAQERFGTDCWSLPLTAVSDGRRPLHFSDSPGQIKATEALTTMVLLAGSELCVRTDSALSAWAMTLPGQRRAVVVRSTGE